MSEELTPPLDLPIELQVALDFVAPRLNRSSGPAIVLASSARTGTAARAWLDEPVRSAAEDRPARTLLLLPTSSDQAGDAARQIAPGGRLGAVARGRLAPLFDRLRGVRAGGAPVEDVEGALRAAGLEIEARCGVGRGTSPMWALLVRLAERGERPDLADRFEFAFRRSMRAHGGSLAQLVGVVARREG